MQFRNLVVLATIAVPVWAYAQTSDSTVQHTNQAAVISDTTPDTTKPDTTKPKPDTTKPDTTKKPDTTTPAPAPESEVMSLLANDTTVPDTTKPDTTKPKPDTTKKPAPDTTKPADELR